MISCRAPVTGAEVKAGASLVLATVMVKDWFSAAPLKSVTERTTEAAPTSEFSGVPDSVAEPSVVTPVRVSHAGIDRAVMVRVSPTSGSEEVIL